MGQGLWPGRRVNVSDITGVVPIVKGGTGATNAAGARTNLGVGSGSPPLPAALLGTGDGVTLTFNFALAGVTCSLVFVAGIEQAKTKWNVSAGTGPSGVDQLVFTAGNAPPNGVEYVVEALIST